MSSLSPIKGISENIPHVLAPSPEGKESKTQMIQERLTAPVSTALAAVQQNQVFLCRTEVVTPPSSPGKKDEETVTLYGKPKGPISTADASFNSPEKLVEWQLRRDENGRIDPRPSPNTKETIKKRQLTGDILYRVKHHKKGCAYIGSVKATFRPDGKEKNTVFRRLQSYWAELKKEGHLRPVAATMAKSPEKCTFGIIAAYPGIDEPGLLQEEARAIEARRQIDPVPLLNVSDPNNEPLRTTASKKRSRTQSINENMMPNAKRKLSTRRNLFSSSTPH